VRVITRQTGFEFAEQLRLLVDEDYPQAEQIVLVVDNLKTHSPAHLSERFARRKRSVLPASWNGIIHRSTALGSI
jgi:hypothetical protein